MQPETTDGGTDATDAAYALARARYADLGIDTDDAIERLAEVALSLPCWQGDEVRGFESAGDDAQVGDVPVGDGSGAEPSGGGIQATGGHPGRARNADELRADLEVALALIPGTHRVNLHAMYGELGGRRVDRDAIGPEHFARWVAWAAERGVALDFNATLFAHPMVASGFTLSSPDAAVREFWIAHVRRCRAIGADIGRRLGTACRHNLWIPDGMKDTCVDRAGYRARLRASLDEVFAEAFDPRHLQDSVEAKLFGIGSESFVVGSHEFYFAYAIRRGLVLCLDLGHFHPTESVADKLSALLLFLDPLLLHISRGVRWDSDHVAVLDDVVRDVALEIVRSDALDRVQLALDSFDGSINRVAAWVIGARATQQALLLALLEPRDWLQALERDGDYTARLALLELVKTLPFGAVWDAFCVRHAVPPGMRWLDAVRGYEADVLARR